MKQQGGAQIALPGLRSPIDADAQVGLLFLCIERTKFTATDDSLRRQIWIPGELNCRLLDVLLERPVDRSPRCGSAPPRRILGTAPGGGARRRRERGQRRLAPGTARTGESRAGSASAKPRQMIATRLATR